MRTGMRGGSSMGMFSRCWLTMVPLVLPEILDRPLTGGGILIYAGVMRGDEFVVEHHGVGRGASQRDGFAGQRHGGAGLRAIDDDQQCRARIAACAAGFGAAA